MDVGVVEAEEIPDLIHREVGRVGGRRERRPRRCPRRGSGAAASACRSARAAAASPRSTRRAGWRLYRARAWRDKRHSPSVECREERGRRRSELRGMTLRGVWELLGLRLVSQLFRDGS